MTDRELLAQWFTVVPEELMNLAGVSVWEFYAIRPLMEATAKRLREDASINWCCACGAKLADPKAPPDSISASLPIACETCCLCPECALPTCEGCGA